MSVIEDDTTHLLSSSQLTSDVAFLVLNVFGHGNSLTQLKAALQYVILMFGFSIYSCLQNIFLF